MRYIDEDGREITLQQWIDHLGPDRQAVGRVIKLDELPDGRTLRTFYFGTDFPESGVFPFATAIFAAGREPLFMNEIGQYATKDAALAGHATHLEHLRRVAEEGNGEGAPA